MEEASGYMIKLKSGNYSIWKSKMEDLLYGKDLFSPVKLGNDKPESTTKEAWEKEHRKALGLIRQWVDISLYSHVSKEVNAKVLWDKLQTYFENTTGMNKLSAFNRLITMKYKEGTPVIEHLNDVQDALNQLVTMGINFDDELQGLYILSSFPSSWETVTITDWVSLSSTKIIRIQLNAGYEM